MEPTWAFKKPNSISHQIWKSQVVQPLFSLQTTSVFPLQTSTLGAFLCICESCKPIKTTPFLELNTEEGYLPIMPSNKLKQTLVIIWATCEEIIKEIKGKRKKKLGLFYIWLFLYHSQFCAIKKKHPQWKKRERHPAPKIDWTGVGFYKIPTGINYQSEKKKIMCPFPSSFSCLNPTTLLFSLFSFGVQHVDMKLGTSLSHHLVGEGLSKSRQNPTSKLPKL